ncbi:hypothetical protein C5167_036810 [Papaver somniferum]|uniref:Uncharacterized protein n=1 Tax=Papaver somniferum TaxID=3469 RepID=A0A4Y7I842_PAPSO|nr:hypothetical protein C5167_036810 [Papaver somniferum]
MESELTANEMLVLVDVAVREEEGKTKGGYLRRKGVSGRDPPCLVNQAVEVRLTLCGAGVCIKGTLLVLLGGHKHNFLLE